MPTIIHSHTHTRTCPRANAVFLVSCTWYFPGCNVVISHLSTFNVQSGKNKTWMSVVLFVLSEHMKLVNYLNCTFIVRGLSGCGCCCVAARQQPRVALAKNKTKNKPALKVLLKQMNSMVRVRDSTKYCVRTYTDYSNADTARK